MIGSASINALLVIFVLGALGLTLSLFVGTLTNTLAPCVISFIGHAGLSIFIMYEFGLDAIGPDASSYHDVASRMADAFAGTGPSVPFAEGKEGWIYVLGAIYLVFGKQPEAGLLVIAMMMAIVPAIMASSSRMMGWGSSAQTAAWFSVLLPALVIWPSSILREGPSIFLLSLMVLAVGLYHLGRVVPAGALLVAATFGMMWIRPTIGIAALAGIALATILVPWRRNTGTIGALVFLLPSMLALPFGLIRGGSAFDLTTAGTLRENLTLGASTSTGATSEGWDSFEGAALSMLHDLPGASFGPFLWQIGSQPLTLAVDGVTFLALIILAVVALRRSNLRREVIALLLPSIGVLIVVAAAFGNYGFAVRQRSQAAVFLIPIAAAGWILLRQRHRPPTPQDEIARTHA
ncbi:MAG: hypothetical protein Q7L55_10025 [Actinomycetota bacterium]|nr:hypothetical protein [Actinomycetota bacterium]